MEPSRAKLVATLRAFCAAHPGFVLFDEPTSTLLEIRTGKRLPIPLSELVAVSERINATNGQPYLRIELGDGRQLAIASVGIAFPTIPPGVPGAPPLPAVACLGDLAGVRAQIAHLLETTRGQKPPREAVDLVVLALGILEGARRAGFEVSEEERDLDRLLNEIERRR
jgi:hypothetical protein